MWKIKENRKLKWDVENKKKKQAEKFKSGRINKFQTLLGRIWKQCNESYKENYTDILLKWSLVFKFLYIPKYEQC